MASTWGAATNRHLTVLPQITASQSCVNAGSQLVAWV